MLLCGNDCRHGLLKGGVDSKNRRTTLRANRIFCFILVEQHLNKKQKQNATEGMSGRRTGTQYVPTG